MKKVWNITSIYNTSLYNMGIRADTHLFLETIQYYWFTNGTGIHCSFSNTPIIPQNLFSDPSTYSGTVDFYGENSYVFNATYSSLPISLYVSVEQQRPVGLLFGSTKFSKLFQGSEIFYVTFEEVSSFPDPSLFAIPNFCS